MTGAKPKLFLDMDNVMVNTLPVLNELAKLPFTKPKPDQITGVFRDLAPLPGILTSVPKLAEHYEMYVLSTAPWDNPSAWQDKLAWLQQYFGVGAENPFYKRVIIAHDKGLVHRTGGLLVDDRPYHGASAWVDPAVPSAWLQYGADERLQWQHELTNFLLDIAENQAQGQALPAAITTANARPNPYLVHGDLKDFQAATWE
ncbi:hypothetical protein M8332_00230 [Fructilactobacillus ixorae]|uniref:Uncharacterized protein n=1 Tax=Fructilactobacillus ixorae TaxID=1750535 RepID=A0ABY5C4P0_9LACO|nr:hypothetical protein [Fructilactobacillus ixorae]USS93332.1 hypothetical protein M8332_00230 [Fructilactobacillus ixorae]